MYQKSEQKKFQKREKGINLKEIEELQIKVYKEFKLQQENKAIENNEKKCHAIKEFVDKEYCDSFSLNKGCMYKDKCLVYNELKNSGGNKNGI